MSEDTPIQPEHPDHERESVTPDDWRMSDVFDPHRDEGKFVEGERPVEFLPSLPGEASDMALLDAEAKAAARRAIEGAFPGMRQGIAAERTQRVRKDSIALDALVKTKEALDKAMIDPETGLRNKQAFDVEFPRIFEKVAAGKLAVFYLDANGLNRVNGATNHTIGNQYLEAVASGVAGSIRESDLIYRIGGDEFVVLAAGNIDEATAIEIQRRFTDHAEANIAFFSTKIPLPAKQVEQLYLGVSSGFAIKKAEHTAESIKTEADEQCKEAKEEFYTQIESETGKDLRRKG